MKKTIISSDQAPAAIGPYSQAVMAGGFLYLSGQIPLNPQTMQIEGDTINTQTEQVFANIGAILISAKLDFSDAIKVVVYLTDLADFTKVNEIYAKYIPAPFPARTTVQVAALPRGAKIEIELTALLK